MELTYVTTNPGKVHSMQRHLQQYGVSVRQEPLDSPEPRSSDVQEIAEHKAKYAFSKINRPLVVLDAGFYVQSLNGFPRAFVNFALETIGLDGVLRLAEGKDRACEFRECIAYIDERTVEPLCFFASIPGTLSSEPRGELQPHHWSALSRIFVPQGYTKTLAELSKQEYDDFWKTFPPQHSCQDKFGTWYVKERMER
jgi:XTP/dITP diphosphohydrolase